MLTMLYKWPGPHHLDGDMYDYITTEDVAAAQAEGWHLTMDAARAAGESTQDDNVPPTRAELEQKAAELGIKFDKRTTDKKLGELIKAALKE